MLDLTEVKENSGGFEVLPAGLYRVQVAEAEVKESQSGGEYIKVAFDVFDVASGDKKPGKVWHNFNTKNSNAKAVEIGLGQLKAFLRVSKFADANHLTDVNDLLGLTAVVKIKVKKGTEQYPDDRNEIANFDPKVETSATPAAASKSKNPFG